MMIGIHHSKIHPSANEPVICPICHGKIDGSGSGTWAAPYRHVLDHCLNMERKLRELRREARRKDSHLIT